MRPSGRGEFESLYFTYPKFEPPSTSFVKEQGYDFPVVIVGAGPIGMAAALTLARHGIHSVLVDNKSTFNDGSRAICVSRSSLYALERMGAAQPFIDKSLGWTTGRGYFEGREIGRFEMPHSADEKYLPMYNLQQQYIEQFLHAAVVASSMIDLRWQSEVIRCDSNSDQVKLKIRSPNGDYHLNAQYCLAADGAHSPLRAMLGLRLKGTNLEGRYVIADVQMEHDFPTERRAFFEPAANPGGTVLIHRQPDNIWRIDYQLAPNENADEAIQEANIRARVGAILADIGHDAPWELEWWSIYSANTLCLDEYRQDRVFFIGDSAHIVPIFGVRGLNNGLLDAENIGWKLARVLNKTAPDALLESYSLERRGATLDVFENATKSAAFMTPPTAGYALMRKAALSLSLSQEFTRGLANPRQMVPYDYQHSPLTSADLPGFDTGPTPGSICPNLRLKNGYLLDEMGEGYTLLFFGDEDSASALVAAGQTEDPGFKLLRFTQEDAQIATAFDCQNGGAYLLRPDQHVAARWHILTPATLAAAMSF